MRAAIALLTLTACTANGHLTRPRDLTDAELCQNAEFILVTMEAGGAGPIALRRNEATVDDICARKEPHG